MKIALSTLFPELESSWTDRYTADERGYIWSTRQGTERILTLQSASDKTSINRPNGYLRGKAITSTLAIKRKDIINRLAKLKVSQSQSLVPFFPVTLIASGYIIGSATPQGLSFANHPKIHKSLADVRTETERLAKSNPGMTFVYLEIKGNCVAGGVNWS